MKRLGMFPTFAAGASMFLTACGVSNAPQATSSTSEKPPQNDAGQKASAVKVSRDNPCSVLFPTEVGEILGAKSQMREVMDEATCRYHFEPSSKPKTEAGEETFIEVKVHWKDGREAVTAARLAGRLLGGSSSGFEKLSGTGDEAWLAPMAAYLWFSKGDVGVEIDMRMMPGEKDKAVRLARLIASRI